jgi:hypothetical protein
LYFEIHNLRNNVEGKTLLCLEYVTMYKGNNENLITELFTKGNDEIVSTKYTKSGKGTSSNEFISFDVNRLSPGSYIMEKTDKDVNANINSILKQE